MQSASAVQTVHMLWVSGSISTSEVTANARGADALISYTRLQLERSRRCCVLELQMRRSTMHSSAPAARATAATAAIAARLCEVDHTAPLQTEC
jgi:hypothetical protein